MITIGSRGEVEPCVALGMGLQAEGHAVGIATHPNFRGFIEGRGLNFALINIDIEAFLSSEAGPTQKNRNPLMMDQPFWGRRLEALGVGAHPIPMKQLTADKLAAAIEKMARDATMREKAKTLSRKILSENGTAEAVVVIKQILAK